ncbi:MAG: hypothetical protein ABSD49_06385 [Candidatus Bathyarchaeia archaeon]
MKDKQTAISVVIALLLVSLALLSLQLAAWLAVAFLLVYGIVVILRKKRSKERGS